MNETRLDALLVKKGYVPSRTLAQKLISSGLVQVKMAGQWLACTKPSKKFYSNVELLVEKSEEQKYVSRAGLKLEGALETAQIDVSAITVLDVGQSTGGFTDCLLQKGAKRVIGIDVGRNQLSEKLKSNVKVTCIEQMNARELSFEQLKQYTDVKFPLIVMDVSFISQTLILPRLVGCLAENGLIVSLVKPQFEVGPNGIGKGGLVKSHALYKGIQQSITKCATIQGLTVVQYFESKITGGDGNREFFMIAYQASKHTVSA